MKIFSAIVIPNEYKDRIDILYECDSKRNIQCKGHNSCKECRYTYELKYAKDIKDEIQIVTNTINERTDESIKNSDVCLFMPGGIGTTYEILSSMETKRAGEHNNKIVIVNLFGYYNEFFKMLDEMYEKNFINESDKNMYKIVDTIEEAIDYIKK